MNLLIKNGRVIDPSQNLDKVADVLTENGRIKSIGENLNAPEGVRVLAAEGKIVAPGFLDIHVHGRTPGQEYKEDTRDFAAQTRRRAVA